MDGSRFDALSRAVSAAPRSRRRLLALLLSLSLGGALTALPDEKTEAKRSGNNRRARNRRYSGRRKDKRQDQQEDENEDARQKECVRQLTARGCTGVIPGKGKGKCPPGTNLVDVDLNRCIFEETVFDGVTFSTSPFRCTDSGKVNFYGANLIKASFAGAELDCANFEQANMVGVIMTKANAERANFTSASLQDAQFQGAQMDGARFSGLLYGADFTGTACQYCNFTGAKMYRAIMQDTYLPLTRWIAPLTLGAQCPDGFQLVPIITTETCCGHLNGHRASACSDIDDDCDRESCRSSDATA
jgi:uncharacterized protein YjbI with pentapeptide repeats